MGPETSLTDGGPAIPAVPGLGGPDPDEAALVAAVLRKDRKATAAFVARYADAVHGYVSRRLAPRADQAEDLVQDVFLVALQRLQAFEGQSSVLGWLLGIARHKVEDVYRARLREPDGGLDADAPHPAAIEVPDFEASIDRDRLHEKTRRVLASLPVAQASVLLWRYWEKRSTREMAVQTGRTEKAMERLLARARAQFRRAWEADKP